jgi:hypothetical protein
MSGERGWGKAALAALVFVVVSLLAAALYVTLGAGVGRGDLRAFAFWCVVAAVAAIVPLRVFGRWSARSPSVWVLLAAPCSGVMLATVVTFVVASILGPWVGAFSFPILLCWIAGATAALLTSAVSTRRRLLPFALVLWPLSLAAVAFAVGITTSPEPPELLVLTAPGTSPAEVEAVWHLFDVPGTPTPRGYNPEGIRGVSRLVEGDAVGVRVGFHPGTDPARRAAVTSRAVASPLVAQVREVSKDRDGREHERVLKDVRP